MQNVKIKIKVLLFCLAVFTVLVPSSVFAAGPIETDKDCTLHLTYCDTDLNLPAADVTFDIYRVADVDAYSTMTLTDDFSSYPVVLEGNNQDSWRETALTLQGYVAQDRPAAYDSGKTDENGELFFPTSGKVLKPGLYLILGERVKIGNNYYDATPSLLFIPGINAIDNAWDYDLAISQKYEKRYEAPTVSRQVKKVWNDEGYETVRPEEVTVTLLCDGETYETVKLSKDNNWEYTWDNLDAKKEWLVAEEKLTNYAVTVTKNETEFVITNKFTVFPNDDPPVQKKVTGDTPSEAGTFVFILTAKDASAPMPEGSNGKVKEVSVKGAGSVEFGRIEFTQSGTYVYTISEKNTGLDGYTYDSTVYTVTYEITESENGLVKNMTITDGSSNSVSVAEFNNVYEAPVKKLPQTGMIWWPVPFLFALGLVFILCGFLRRGAKS